MLDWYCLDCFRSLSGFFILIFGLQVINCFKESEAYLCWVITFGQLMTVFVNMNVLVDLFIIVTQIWHPFLESDTMNMNLIINLIINLIDKKIAFLLILGKFWSVLSCFGLFGIAVTTRYSLVSMPFYRRYVLIKFIGWQRYVLAVLDR